MGSKTSEHCGSLDSTEGLRAEDGEAAEPTDTASVILAWPPEGRAQDGPPEAQAVGCLSIWMSTPESPGGAGKAEAGWSPCPLPHPHACCSPRGFTWASSMHADFWGLDGIDLNLGEMWGGEWGQHGGSFWLESS